MNIKLAIKKNRTLIIIGLICLLFLFFEAFQMSSIFDFSINYIFDPSFKDSVIATNNTTSFLTSLSLIIKNNFQWFDMSIVMGSRLIQLYVAPLAALGALAFGDYYNNMGAMEMYRADNRKKYIAKKTVSYALKFALCTFIAFMIYYIFCACLYNPEVNWDPLIRTLFTDILGKQFVNDHMFIYYMLDGFVSYFFVPFVWCWFGNIITVLIKKKFTSFIIVNGLYFVTTAIAIPLGMVNHIALYASPVTLLSSGSYSGISTIGCFMYYFILIFVCIMLLKKYIMNKDIA